MNVLPSKRLRLIIPIALIAALAVIALILALTPGVRDFVRLAIVFPLAYIAWLADLVLRSIPQFVYWALVVAAGALIAWRSLGLARVAAQTRRAAPPPLVDRPDRSFLAARLELLTHLEKSAFSREKIAFELRALVVDVLVYQERQSKDDIEVRIRTNAAPALPADVRELLLDWQHWLSVEPTSRWVAWLQPLLAWLGLYPQSQSSSQAASFDAKLSAVMDYLEKQMGIVGMPEEIQ